MSTKTIVIDNGSGFIKAGVAGAEAPRAIFPTIIGKPKSEQLMVGGQNKDFFVGYEAVAKKDLLDLCSPIANGVVQNWDNITKIYHHTFYDELHVIPEDYSVLVTEKPLAQRADREKMIEIMFNTFNVKSYNAANQAVLSLFSLGKTTGVVYDSGEGFATTVSIYEGYGLPHAIIPTAVSGSLVTKYLYEQLKGKNVDLNTANQIKEKTCLVAVDYQAVTAEREDSIDYQLPDGSTIELGTIRYTAPEIFFQPGIIGAKCDSAHQVIFNSINKCENEIRKQLFGSIVLSGGSTMFKGLNDRIQKEITSLAPSSMKVNVIATAGRKNMAWLGGSIIASLEAFPQMSIDRQEFNEEGPSIVHRKCFC